MARLSSRNTRTTSLVVVEARSCTSALTSLTMPELAEATAARSAFSDESILAKTDLSDESTLAKIAWACASSLCASPVNDAVLAFSDASIPARNGWPSL